MGDSRTLVEAVIGFWPLAAESSVRLGTVEGLAARFGAGLIYGYSFQRTRSILAPWLAHALSGVAFLIMGAGSLVGQLA
jgi:membrane protease YdiL (CAAX protease family)